MKQDNTWLIVKKLSGSDLGWFDECRKNGTARGKQKGIHMHAAIIREIFPESLLNKGLIMVGVSYKGSDGRVYNEVGRPIRFQAKDWRLTGAKVEGEIYGDLKPGDYMIMIISGSNDNWKLIWDVAYSAPDMQERSDLFAFLKDAVPNTDLVRPGKTFNTIVNKLQSISPELFKGIKSSGNRKMQVRRVLANSHILSQVLANISSLSGKNQLEYIEVLEFVVDCFSDHLEGQIEKLELNHKTVWKGVKGKRIGFVDGGVASIQSLGSEPIAVRVGTYTVIPGLEPQGAGNKRETFNYCPQLVDELFDDSGDEAVFEDFSDNTSKLRDMARITMEAAGAYNSIVGDEKCDYLFLHGPLVNPVAPYADFPSFTQKTLDLIKICESDISEQIGNIPVEDSGKESANHFISVYLYLLKKIFESGIPVTGIIERSSDSRIVARTIFEKRKEEGFCCDEADDVLEIMRRYKITDSILFACLLREGEYIRPIQIDKNTLHKSPDRWKPVINMFPRPVTTYLKTTETSLPFRVEMSPGNQDETSIMMLVYHTARLLPKYAFPVGLDIADKFAKVPAWMSKQLSKEQSAVLLKKAIESGSRQAVDLMRLYLTGNTRDWLFRPGFDR